MIHVYGFVAPESPPPPTDGLDGAPVETLDLGPVAALLSRHPEAPARREESILRHAQVVDAAMAASGDVLPARFGTAYPDEAALAVAVHPRAAELAHRLAEIRGCVEIGVRVLVPEEPEEAARSGREYMHSRLRETTDRTKLAERVHGALSELARESTHRVPHAGPAALVAAYLVPSDARGLFQQRVDEIGRGLTLVCTGPWPPYSFAEAA